MGSSSISPCPNIGALWLRSATSTWVLVERRGKKSSDGGFALPRQRAVGTHPALDTVESPIPVETPGAETTQGAVLGALGVFLGPGGDGAAGIIVEESSSSSLRCCWNHSVDPTLCGGELQKAGKLVKNECQLCRVLGQAGGDEQTQLGCEAMGQGCSEQSQGCAMGRGRILPFIF